VTTNIVNEIKNLVICSVATVLTIIVFEVALSTAVLYRLARLTDKVRIQLGLMPEHMLPKLTGGYSYSIVLVNKAAFILLSLIFGFVAFKLISKRGTKFSGWIYGIFMTVIFYFVGSALVIISKDPFNWLAVMFGVPVTFFIQSFLATFLLKKANNKNSLCS